MKIEIVNFYKALHLDNKKSKFVGTMRVRLPEIGIEILGVSISKTNRGYFICLPQKKGFDHVTKNEIVYSVFIFCDKSKQKEFMDCLIKACVDHMLKLTESGLESQEEAKE